METSTLARRGPRRQQKEVRAPVPDPTGRSLLPNGPMTLAVKRCERAATIRIRTGISPSHKRSVCVTELRIVDRRISTGRIVRVPYRRVLFANRPV